MFTPRALSNRYIVMSGGDFLVAAIAAYMCFAIFSQSGYPAGVKHALWEIAPPWQMAALVGLFFTVLMYFSNSDALERRNVARSVFAVLVSGAGSLSGILIVVMLLSDALFAHYKICVTSLAITTICLILWRLGLDLLAKSHVTRRVAILGDTRIGRILAREIEERQYLGYRLIDAVHAEHRGCAVGESSSLGQASYFPASLEALMTDSGPLTLVVDPAETMPLGPEQLLKMRAMGIGVNDCESFYELITGKLPVTELRYSWLVFAPGYVRERWRVAVKRLIDIVAGFALLVLTLPIALIAAIGVKLDSPGPIFYQQDRVGMGGLVFRIFKFRSMRVDAETRTGAAWAALRDPRVTRVGRVIRLFRIDELPQLINVIKGEMSLVGPGRRDLK